MREKYVYSLYDIISDMLYNTEIDTTLAGDQCTTVVYNDGHPVINNI